MKAFERWNFFVFQYAHEAVHLLEPKAGFVSAFEEGIAVIFSMYIQEKFCSWIPVFPTESGYLKCEKILMKSCGSRESVLSNAKVLLDRSKGFSKITKNNLMNVFGSNLSEQEAEFLVQKFDPRKSEIIK